MTSRDRIIQFVEFKKISKNQFYKETGLSNGFLDKNNHPGADKLERIIYTYPEINPTWLLIGEGDMLLKKEDIILNRFTTGAKKYDYVFTNALTEIMFSKYEKETGNHLSYDCFSKLALNFNKASKYLGDLQKSFETELLVDLENKLREYSKKDGGNVDDLPEPLKNVLDKYSEIYNKLESVEFDISNILDDTSLQNVILEYYKNRSSNG